MKAPGSAFALVLLAGLAFAGPSGAEEKWMEGAGVAKAEPGEGKTGPGRQAALQAALAEAVQNVAVELLAAEEAAAGKPASEPAALRERAARALGGDPSAYVSRYQIRDDRGVQPRLLLTDPSAKAEYQLVVVAQVDVSRVRQKVGARAPAPVAPTPPSKEEAPVAKPDEAPPADGAFAVYAVEVDQIGSYHEYTAIRQALVEKIGATQALPREVGRGRAVFTVEAPVPATALPAALSKAVGPSLPLEIAGPITPDRVPLRIRPGKPPLPVPSGLTR